MTDDPGADPAYRPCVGVMLIDAKGRVFVARRIDTPGEAWQMPQGGIDAGEAPRAAALRELEEEIGTAKAEFVAESSRWISYDLPGELQGKFWGGRFRGQRQKWFLFRFTGTDADIDIAAGDHPEFHDWRWAPMETLTEMIVPFKRRIYEDVVAEFESLARYCAK